MNHPLRTLLYDLFLEPFLRRVKQPLERPLGQRYPSPIFLVSLSVLCPQLLWAQKTPPLHEGSVPFFDCAPLLKPVAEAQSHVRFVPVLSQNFEANKGQTESQVTFPPLRTNYSRTPINNRPPMELQPSSTSEPPGKAKYFTRSASSEWATPFYGKVPSPPVHHGNDLQHRIPGAGPIILRISKQAQAHPHVTGVLKLFSPQF